MASGRLRFAAAALLAGAGGSLPLVSAQVLNVTVGDAGNFSIAHNGVQWLVGGDVQVGDFSARKGSLLVLNQSQSTGQDAIGAYTLWSTQWAAKPSPGEVLMETSLRTYPKATGTVVFEQRYYAEVKVEHMRRPAGAAATLFPAFERNPGPGDLLDCFAYHNFFPMMQSCNVSSYAETHQGGAPLVIFNATDLSLPMLVLSPLDLPKAQHMATTKTVFGLGVKSGVDKIPAGWRQTSILSAGKGINDGMMAWGDKVLQWTGKPRSDMYGNDIVGRLGFWTTGYYHYSTGPDKNKTYEEVLPQVKAYHDSLGVPFRHWHFDSWFYPKETGRVKAEINWTAADDVFPHGMVNIQSKLRMPMAMHSKLWSPVNDYIKNLHFDWYISKTAAFPQDPAAFFKWFFQQQQGWGLKMYEQDWMCQQYDRVDAFHTNISLGDLWLRSMADGAAGSGLAVLYCMPYTYDILASTSLPAVMSARASDDYITGSRKQQWSIGGTALYYWAIGILPFKDGFYSSSERQAGGAIPGPEKDPDREAIMASLSCAMVGAMDGIDFLNASRVNATCRVDGTILKPDRPVTSSDWCFRSPKPETCWVYHTVAEPPGSEVAVHYLYMDSPVPFSPDMVHLSNSTPSSSFVIYNWYTGEVSRMEPALELGPGYEGHVYALVTPVRNGWALVGEVAKYVPVSRRRINAVAFEVPPTAQGPATAGAQSMRVTVIGAGEEEVRICAVEAAMLALRCHTLQFRIEGTQDLLFQPSVIAAAAGEGPGHVVPASSRTSVTV